MKNNWSDIVKFHPWVGNKYSKSDNRILILGESHYDWEEDGRKHKATGKNFTIKYVDGLIYPDCRSSNYGNKGTWTKLEKAFIGESGKEYNESTIKNFWHSVSFYNFVQKSVPDGSRISPESDNFKNSTPALEEVISNLKPHTIILLGMRLWGHSPLPEAVNSRSFKVDGRTTDSIVYNYKNGKCFAFPIYHPSAGFNSEHWGKVIKKGISNASKVIVSKST